MVRYGVKFATDDEMPPGHDVVLVKLEDETILFYRDSKVDCRVVAEAWAALHSAAPDLLLRAS